MAAVREELQPLWRRNRPRRIEFGKAPAWILTKGNYECVAVLSGMGRERARRWTERAIAAFAPDYLLTAGFGGALNPSLPPGAVVLAAEFWQLEPREGALNRLEPILAGPPAALVGYLQEKGINAYEGVSITTPAIMPKASLPPQITRLPLPVIDLETAAVALAAQAHRLPLVGVRAITDTGSEEIAPFLADLINTQGIVTISSLIQAVRQRPQRLGYLGHLWRRSRLAGRQLAKALNLILDYINFHV